MTMRYSKERKEAVLRKMLPPGNKSIVEISREEGISQATLFNWLRARLSLKREADEQIKEYKKIEGNLSLWGAASYDAYGRVSAEYFGNALLTEKIVNAANTAFVGIGLEIGIAIGSAANASIDTYRYLNRDGIVDRRRFLFEQ